MHRHTDSLEHITDSTHCWKRMHTHTHTEKLSSITCRKDSTITTFVLLLFFVCFIRCCYIHFINSSVMWGPLVLSLFIYNNFETQLFPLIYCCRMYCLDIKCLTHTFTPPLSGFSLLALCRSLSFTAFQNHPHTHAAEPTCACHLFLFSQIDSCVGQLHSGWVYVNTVVQALSSRPSTTLKSSSKHNIHITS